MLIHCAQLAQGLSNNEGNEIFEMAGTTHTRFNCMCRSAVLTAVITIKQCGSAVNVEYSIAPLIAWLRPFQGLDADWPKPPLLSDTGSCGAIRISEVK